MSFTIKQNDTSPAIENTLLDGSAGINLSSVSEVRFIMQDKYERIIIDDNTQGDVSILDPNEGVVQYQWQPDDTDTAGTYYAEWEVEYSDGGVETFPTDGYLEVIIEENLA